MKTTIREKPTEKRVRYDIFCKKCKYYDLAVTDDPCFSCLGETYGISSIPINYKKETIDEARVER